MTIYKWILFCVLVFMIGGCSSGRDLQTEVDLLEKRLAETESQVESLQASFGKLRTSSDDVVEETRAMSDLLINLAKQIKAMRPSISPE